MVNPDQWRPALWLKCLQYIPGVVSFTVTQPKSFLRHAQDGFVTLFGRLQAKCALTMSQKNSQRHRRSDLMDSRRTITSTSDFDWLKNLMSWSRAGFEPGTSRMRVGSSNHCPRATALFFTLECAL